VYDVNRSITLNYRTVTVCATEIREGQIMADQPAWQDNKLLAERNLHMLQNEIATDVCFEFHTQESGVTHVHAHTFMLINSSPVFEAMFCGGMAEACPDRSNIKIPDIDADIFKEMLRCGRSVISYSHLVYHGLCGSFNAQLLYIGPSLSVQRRQISMPHNSEILFTDRSETQV